jgi:transposase
MIVLGADMHKRSHTIAAIAASTGELLGDKTIDVGDRGFLAALDWARGLGADRIWALEDCRHVSGAFERFLLVSGERVVGVATRLMADQRRASRDRGKSDRIDALAVARAALREGIERLPVAELAGVELDIRLLVDHRERLQAVRAPQRATCAADHDVISPAAAWRRRRERRSGMPLQRRTGPSRRAGRPRRNAAGTWPEPSAGWPPGQPPAA